MSKIIPIKDLRDTNYISEWCQNHDAPLFISKNGYSHLVIMSNQYYEKLLSSPSNEFIPLNLSSHQYASLSEDAFAPIDQTFFGFVKVGSANFIGKIGCVSYNVAQIEQMIGQADKQGVKVLVFPELCLTSYSCRDLFYQNQLLADVILGLERLKEVSRRYEMLFVVGAPLAHKNGIFNCAVVYCGGDILAVYAKQYLPTSNEFYEGRQFTPCPANNDKIVIGEKAYPFGNKFILVNKEYYPLKIGVEICEDLWAPLTPSTKLATQGANLILNLSASNEVIGKEEYRRSLISSTSARLMCGYVYSSSGEGESTTDVVYSGYRSICENGNLLVEGELFDSGLIISEIDIEKLNNERRRTTSFIKEKQEYDEICFSLPLKNPTLTRKIKQNPFVINENSSNKQRYQKIIKMQALGLKQRLTAISCKKVVVGLSGGLDSTLALLVAKEAFVLLKYDLKDVYAITLPCFGTSKRTHDNAVVLAEKLGVSFKEININKSVVTHFEDIGHDINIQNATYENAQARERTQVLLDYSNDINALMVGTGDLSELCLGWTTYNGDHMSSYSVNSSIPKTLVQDLVKTYALEHEEVKDVLLDILHTPISPELLPQKEGEIAQKTEESIGPYELHDFFIYYFLRFNFSPLKILHLAIYAYRGKYSDEEIRKWLILFLKRFYANQFKRSCLPDGVKVGTVSISPRGDWRMPSDASSEAMISSLISDNK